MTGNQYKAIIDSFHVETNPKYQPSGSTTYCNIFAQDVMDECGTPLPSGVCATMLNQLESGSSSWGSVTYQNAQVRANNGYPTIAITSDHVAVVRPNEDGSTPTSRREVRITQAGRTLLNNSTLNYGWPPARLNEIVFYSWGA